ncbi:MAG: AAA family ATPase [Lachnospiraceae bacterium]|nr:AAA family ATPase [Lachnospiraceae bacterium]
MKDATVRLSGISIKNFKNVKNGEISFQNPWKKYRASVLGLYGQNGSGKTALIDALQILKNILCGKKLDPETADYINVDAESADLEYVFDISTLDGNYKAYYECCIRKDYDDTEQNLDHDASQDKQSKTVIFNEVLSFSFENANTRIRKSRFIDTRTAKVFIPAVKYGLLIGKDEKTKVNLLVAKKMAEQTSRSFLFSRELLGAAKEHGKNQMTDVEYSRHMNLLETLIFYGHYELFVINQATSGAISMNFLPSAFKYEDKKTKAAGLTILPLDTPSVIFKETVGIVKNVIKNMNIVLEQMVPGLTICIKDLGDEIMENGKTGKRIQLFSCKNNKEIPLKYESDGIKKIVMILQLLIAVYNQDSVTVAIDELDSGIFEYLLGETVRIVSEKGKGQLIFTSHNLRMLETLDRGFIAFTTTNPSHRYVRMTNVKDNNNLRDYYYRDITLGTDSQNEQLYEPTHNAEIALAFREAGEIIVP